jgi:hypothetical protein
VVTHTLFASAHHAPDHADRLALSPPEMTAGSRNVVIVETSATLAPQLKHQAQ